MFFNPIKPRALSLAFAALALMVAAAAPARAQEEGVPVVLDEPIVQVNNDVIMLSQLKRETREFKELLIRQRGLTEEQAAQEVTAKQPEIIKSLIEESLLLQKGKDSPRVSESVESEVNAEILRVMRQNGFKSIEELEAAMRGENVSLSEVRETLRRQFTRQAVLQNEVDYKIYFGLTDKELRQYYETNRARFAGVTLSEIFLSLAGRSEAEVLAKARQLVERARAGADFGELAAQHSEREAGGEPVAKKTKGLLADDEGKARWFLISDLKGPIHTAVDNLKAGSVSDPIKTDEGYMILRVNERDDAFKENQVRGALTQERSEKEREAFVRKLRQDAYIKVADNYRELVQPLLDREDAEAKKKETADSAPAKKK
ncbi:MAG TPA: peptidyl-prolyl cis-trans isomerase [Pyrinomonadaceae bacterium]|nr:peptidyl-prolyl cis-trans isomerase [Pyrinomonadaceae bacterium]